MSSAEKRPPERPTATRPAASRTSPVAADPYQDTWIRLSNSSKGFVISTEDGRYVVRGEDGQRYDATKMNGVLHMVTPLGTIDVAYVESSDHLTAAKEEYKRFDPKLREGQRVAQRLTMIDMRAIAAAWSSRANDYNTFAIDAAGDGDVSHARLVEALVSLYAKRVPRVDGWGTPFQFAIAEKGGSFTIRSLGSNALFDETPPGETLTHQQDIVYSNSAFVSYPQGETKSPYE
jgi:hypothetical protein